MSRLKIQIGRYNASKFGTLSRSGTTLRNPLGQKVTLAGFNFYDAVITDNSPASSNGVATITPMATVNYVLDQAVARGYNAVRIQSLLQSYGKPGTANPSRGVYDEAVMVQADRVIQACSQRNLWIMAPLIDRWDYYQGGILSLFKMFYPDTTFTADEIRGQFFGKGAMWGSNYNNVMRLALQGRVSDYANRVSTISGVRWADEPALAIIETGNEIWDATPLWHSNLTAYIKSVMPNKLVADGSAASGETQYTKFWEPGGTQSLSDPNTDIVGAHYYDDHRSDITQFNTQVGYAIAGGKVFLNGEWDWRNNSQGTQYSTAIQGSNTREQFMAAMRASGYSGDFMWAYMGPDTYGHDDGYQIRMDAPQNTEQTNGLAALSAHARLLNPA